MVALAWQNKNKCLSYLHTTKMNCVAINKVNCQETNTVVVCDHNVNMLRLDMKDEAIVSGMKGRYQVVFEIIQETTQ